MKKTLLASMCAVGSMLYAQSVKTPFQTFADTTGSQNFFYKGVVKADVSGNTYIAGATMNGAGDLDMLVAKYNSSGSLLWMNQYDGGAHLYDFASAIAVDGSGNVFVTGAVTTNTATGFPDLVVAEYNSSGVQQWMSTYDGAGNSYDAGADIILGGAGNVYVTGGSYNTSFNSDIVTLKYNTSGTQLWATVSDGPTHLDDAGLKLSITSGTLIASVGSQSTTTSYRFGVFKYANNTGTPLGSTLTSTLTTAADQITDMVEDGSGNIYLSGAIPVAGHGDDFYLIKFNSSLAIQWQQTYNGAGSLDDKATGVDVDASGNVFVSGYEGTSAQQRDFVTQKYNSSGTLQWSNVYNSSTNGNDEAHDLIIDASDNAIVTGFKTSDINGEDYYTVKYDNSGAKIWEIQSDFTHQDDMGLNMTIVDSTGDVVVTGQTEIALNTFKYYTVKYTEKDIITPIDYAGEAPSQDYSFYANKGQLIGTNDTLIPDVKFYTHHTSPAFYFKNNSSSLVFANIDTSAATVDTLVRVDLIYKGVNGSAKTYPLEQQSKYLNYFLAHTPKGVAGIFGNNRLITTDLYPNIDLMSSSNKSGIKYYYIVKPGGSPTNIQLEYSGASSYSINGTTNDLTINSGAGSLTYKRPIVYQLSPTNTIVAVTGWTPDWQTNGSSNKFKFNIGAYTSSLTLVIEVEQGNLMTTAANSISGNLDYSTFYGGSASEHFNDIKVTSNGDRYVTGYATALSFPTTPGTYEQNFAGVMDAVVLKYTADDSLRFSTFYGGEASDIANSITVKSTGDIVFVGNTGSVGLIIYNTGAVNQISNGFYNAGGGGNYNDGFIVALNNHGTTVNFSRYFGGSKAEQLNSVCVDASDNVYVCGMSSSHDFPSTAAYKSVPGSTSNTDNLDAIVTKFTSNFGVSWQTYYGGDNSGVGGTYTAEYAYDLTVDNAGHVIVVGQTDATDFPHINTTGNSSSNMFFSTSRTGSDDGFIVRLNGGTSTPDYSTYFGGNNGESINRVVYKSATGEVYFAGYGSSKTSFPWYSKAGAYNSIYAVGSNPFVGYMDGSLTKQWCTYFGRGTTPATVWNVSGLSVDGTGAVYVSGYSNDDSLVRPPVAPIGVYIDTVRHAEDGYVTIFDSNKQLKHAHYFGGTGNDRITNSDLYGDTRLYVVGFAGSSNFPIAYSTADASLIDSTYNGGEDGFISRFIITPYNVVGVQEIKSNSPGSVVAYPNPASQSFNIKLTDGLKEKTTAKVYNSVGQMVYQQDIHDELTTIPCNNWSEGIYIVTLSSKSLSASFKIIKQ